MTLVLSCLTDNLAIQASDRRLTWLNGPDSGQPADDDQNKAVLFCGSTSISYTGLARLGRRLEVSTDSWISKLLFQFQAHQVEEAFEAIRREATELFVSLRLNYKESRLRHTFVAVGWARFEDSADLRPYEAIITNAQNAQGDLFERPQLRFSTFIRTLEDKSGFHLGVAGQSLELNESRDLRRLIGSCINRRTGPGPFARVLVAAVRRVAKRNRTVGRRVMITSLPRPTNGARGRHSFILTSMIGRLNSDTPMFMYYPEDSAKGTLYGPHMVCGGTMASNFVASAEIEPDNRVAEPPWLSRVLVLSPRTQVYNTQFDSPENVALLTRDYDFEGYSHVASVGNNPPGPCLIAVPDNSEALRQVSGDVRFLILIRDSSEVGLIADGQWIVRLADWLVRERIDSSLVASFVVAVAGWRRGEVVFELRHLFDQLEFTPTQPPAL